MTTRRGVLTFALVLAVGLIALLVSGAAAKPTRAFSLYVPNLGPVTTLAPGHRACEAPIDGPVPFGGVRVWAQSVGEPGILQAKVTGARGSGPLARGVSAVTLGESPVTVSLNATTPAHRPGPRLLGEPRRDAGGPVRLRPIGAERAPDGRWEA